MSDAGANSWTTGKLGELLPIRYGKSLPEKLRDPSGSYPVFGSSGRVGVHVESLTKGPALIVGRKGNVGAVHLSSEPCWPIDTVYFAEADQGQNLRYFKYLLDSLHIARLDKSTAVPGLSRDDYNALEVTIAPPKEQERIVAELEKEFSRLDEAVTNLKRAKANLKRYKTAVLKAAVEGRLVPTEAELARRDRRGYETGAQLLQRILESRRRQWTGKGKYKEAAAPGMGALPELPEGWVLATLEQLCPVFVDSAHRTPKYVDVGYAAIGPRDIVGGQLHLSSARLVNDEEFAIQTARRVPQPGDVVYSRELSLGWGAIVPGGTNLCLSQGMCLFRPDESVLVPYFMHALNGPQVRRQATYSATGSAHPHLNLTDIKRLVFALPPRDEQLRIVAEVDRRLSFVRELEAATHGGYLRSEHLRQAALAAAFSLV